MKYRLISNFCIDQNTYISYHLIVKRAIRSFFRVFGRFYHTYRNLLLDSWLPTIAILVFQNVNTQKG